MLTASLRPGKRVDSRINSVLLRQRGVPGPRVEGVVNLC